MDDLDLLKKDWQKSDTFTQVSEQDIYGMLHKKSSSIVKWIFYVSIIEIGFGFLVGFLFKFTKYEKINSDFIEKMGIYNYYIFFSFVLYTIVLYFIYQFYKMYKTISVNDNAKQLLSNILKTRKVVKQYIAFNLSAFAVLLIALGSYVIQRSYIDLAIKNGATKFEIPISFTLISTLLLVLITAILTGVFWLIYKLIYGILLKKLKNNYEELKKIDL